MQIRQLMIICLFGLLLSGCVTPKNKQRQELNAAYKRGEISGEVYNSRLGKIEQAEQIYLQQSSEDKILRQQAREREQGGYYIPPEKAQNHPNKGKSCSARCDYYGNCETACE